MVKESIDEFINESGIANLTKNIDILESDISEMKSTLEKEWSRYQCICNQRTRGTEKTTRRDSSIW